MRSDERWPRGPYRDAEPERAPAFGFPLTTPVFAFNFNPGGSLPPVIAKETGGRPPTARSLAEYASPTLAGRKRVVGRSSALAIVIVALAVAFWPLASRTPSVNEKVPTPWACR